ncbi:GWxTD domain-containing protein, partial [candidate division KSB1 bacterium]|nr:GWxTD domain-containing protein [candidate division KSB1 bacterium]
KYLMKITATDMVENQTVAWSDSLIIMPFSDDTLTLSSIEIASTILSQNEKELIFDKNGLRVIPQADRIFSRSLPKIYFYLEAYNFNWEAAAQSSGYTVTYEILNMNGARIMNLKGKPKNKPGATAVIHGALDIQEMVSGAYSLVISVVDLYNNQSARAEKSFMIYNKEDLISKSDLVSNTTTIVDSEKYNQMDEAQINEYFNQIGYLTTEAEKKIFKKLSLTGKRNLIFDFWVKHDPNPVTPVNEREMEYNDMLEYVNETFIQDFRKGWKCDRARILLLYGIPNTKEIVQVSNENKPYEIWHYYNLEEGVIFVFVDKWMNGSFDLVHSTKRNEIHEESWFDVYAQRK